MTEDHNTTEGTPPKIIIDKRGDVILLVGSEEHTAVNLLVSSKVLSLASKVFEAMFNNGFTEEQNLSPASPRTIPLPDDDPAHMTTLCQMVHMQSSDMTDKLEIDALIRFALLCDKYDCTVGVRSWIRVCMSWYSSNSVDSEKLLAIAYMLDLPQEFRDISRNLVHHRIDIDSAKFVIGEQERIPHQVLDMLECSLLKHRLKATSVIVAQDAMIMLEHGKTCPKASETNLAYLGCLKEVALLPFKEEPLVSYLERAQSLTARNITSNQRCSDRSGVFGKTCYNDFEAIRSDLVFEMQKIIDAAQGACLDCAKSFIHGEKSLRCRVAHEGYALHWRELYN